MWSERLRPVSECGPEAALNVPKQFGAWHIVMTGMVILNFVHREKKISKFPSVVNHQPSYFLNRFSLKGLNLKTLRIR